MAKSQQLLLSAMSFAISADGVGREAHILPAGDFTPDDGREMPVEKFRFNSDIAKRVIARMSARKNDTLIDYEHQSMHAANNGKPVIAAGWFNEMEYRQDGLWAINIDWTNQAKSRIKAKECRYISAVFSFDTTTGEIFDIVSVAVTNTPALDGLKALASLNFKFTETDDQPGDIPMEKNVATLTAENAAQVLQITALTTELNTINASVVTLTADLKAANDKVAVAEKATADAAAAAEKESHKTLLAAALSDGRIAPAQKAWAEKQSLAALTDYLSAAPAIVDPNRQGDDQNTTVNHGLTEQELAMCTSMRVDPKDFAATKAADAAKQKLATS